jgi:hypothetical protein
MEGTVCQGQQSIATGGDRDESTGHDTIADMPRPACSISCCRPPCWLSAIELIVHKWERTTLMIGSSASATAKLELVFGMAA